MTTIGLPAAWFSIGKKPGIFTLFNTNFRNQYTCFSSIAVWTIRIKKSLGFPDFPCEIRTVYVDEALWLPATFLRGRVSFFRSPALLHLGHDVSDNPRSLLLYSTSRVRVNVQRRFRAAMLICFHAPSPLVYFGLFRINTMAHTLGMSIQQHQQKTYSNSTFCRA